jgi:hypothetical protein
MKESNFETDGYSIIEGVDLHHLEESFNRLHNDQYIEGGFRFRRLTRLVAPNGQLRALPHKEFMQADNYNKLLGNIRREYQELEADVALSESFISLLSKIQSALQLDLTKAVFGAHQIRIVAKSGSEGEPAPEGIHKDGFDYVVVCCVKRDGIDGGYTELYEDPTGSPIFSEILQPKQLLLINDTTLFHYTSPVMVSKPREEGTRDVFVITIKAGVEH